MNTLGRTGIPIIPSWSELDSSKVMTYLGCPREYLFKHIIGLKDESANIHLAFGGAWADAQEAMRLYKKLHPHECQPPNAYPAMAQFAAVEAFKRRYYKDFPTEIFGVPTDALKSVNRGIECIDQYSTRWHNDDFDVLEAEALLVPLISLDPPIEFHMKIDGIIQDSTGIWVFEDKTTQKRSTMWDKQWDFVFQIGAYTYALRMFYPETLAMGVIINGLKIFPKTNNFVRFHATRSDDQCEKWRRRAKRILISINRDMELLADAAPHHRTLGDTHDLEPFPISGEACRHRFHGCSFPDLCPLANPLREVPQWLEEGPPSGYKIEHWSPVQRFKDAKVLRTLEDKI